ncbi:hypothetical protein AZG88_08020 [Rhodococcus sp. LB1]|nr:hypothetical protein AZG88_08020 [Rhodococcus sp. LB1]
MLTADGEGAFADRLRGFLAEDAVCHEASNLPWGGSWSGIDGFVEMFGAFARSMEEAPNVTATGVSAGPASLMARGELVFREYSLVVPTTGNHPSEHPCIERYLIENGRIQSIAVFFFDTTALVKLLQ